MLSDDVLKMLAATVSCLLTVGVVLCRRGQRYFSKCDAVDEVPTQRIADLHEGLVEVCGTAESKHMVISPLQGEQCLAYYFIVERERPKGQLPQQLADKATEYYGQGDWQPRDHWLSLASGNSDNSFQIDDGTGKVTIDPTGSETHFGSMFEYELEARDGKKFLPPRLRSFVEEKKLEMNYQCRFREWTIKSGATVFVQGTARRHGHTTMEESAGAIPRDRFIIGPCEGSEFLISDTSKSAFRRQIGREAWFNTIAGVVFLAAGVICGIYLGWNYLSSHWPSR